MVWWILSAGFLVGVLLLAIVSVALLGRLRPLQLAARRWEARQNEVAVLQTKVEPLQGAAAQIQERIALIAAHRKET